jgi:hypothetical protein
MIMSKDSDKSTPVPTPHENEHNINQSTEAAKGSKPKFSIWPIVILVILALLVMAAFAGLFEV